MLRGWRCVRMVSREVAERLLESERLQPCFVDSTCVYSGAFKGLGGEEREQLLDDVLEGVEEEDGQEDPRSVIPKDLLELEWGGVPQLEPCHAAGIVQQEEATILDVREDDEVAQNPLETAGRPILHVPLSRISSGHDLAAVGIPEPLGTEASPCLVLCRAGVRSQRVAEHLTHMGRSHVANIAGGITAWQSWVAEGAGSQRA